jgi:hypothetical protein
MLPHGGGLACCVFLRRGSGAGQFLGANPDGGECDEQGEQRDSRRDQEPAGVPGGQGVRRKLGGRCGRLAAGHFAWLVLGQELNKAMFCGYGGPFSAAELDHLADAAVRVFLATYGTSSPRQPSGTQVPRPATTAEGRG